ncbi:MAG TPA: XRE family transcriptional regulator [Fimbriimonas sp.]|nr:XRE family transcriptional regulator [Fimbriimonas sp.]
MERTEVEKAWREYGEGMRRNRLLLGLSIRDVAEKAGISKNTIARLESGKPIQKSSVRSICQVYNCAPTDPTSRRPAQHEGKNYRHFTNGEAVWYALRVDENGKVEQIPGKDAREQEERQRLGRYQLAEFFSLPLRCRREGSRMIPFIVELYGKTDATEDISGERFVYGLRGKTRVCIGEECFELDEGEAAMIDATHLHWMEPAEPVEPGEPGPQVLQVVLP